ncbi:hypothetical protein SERLA73DRAFT_44124, partial [Serpula lacrymans var. lacrymans S7.3]
ALIKRFGTPALFLTLNPLDVSHPLVGTLGHLLPGVWQAMSPCEQSLFVAKNPAAASQFFHMMMSQFLKIVVIHSYQSSGLF